MFAALENMNNRIILFVVLAIAAYLIYKHVYLPRYKPKPVTVDVPPVSDTINAPVTAAPTEPADELKEE
jgi:hypothetical protein